LQNREDTNIYISGMEQLHGIAERWEDLAVRAEANKLRLELRKKEEPWIEEEVKERRAEDLALARALTSYLTGPIDQSDLAKNPSNWERYQKWRLLGLDLWQIIINQGGTPEIIEEAKKG